MSEPAQIPRLPSTTLAWNGPAVEKAIVAAGLNHAIVGLAMGVVEDTVRRWVLPHDHPRAMEPAKMERKADLAAILGVPLADFLVEIDRVSRKPLGLLAGQ